MQFRVANEADETLDANTPKYKDSSASIASSARRQRKSFDNRIKVLEFNLSNAKGGKTSRKLNHASSAILEKISQKKFLRDMMPKSQMFVIITHIHKIAKDFLEKTHKEMPLSAFVYDYIMNKYGIKKIAEKKFRQL
jgi:hypothetical protein